KRNFQILEVNPSKRTFLILATSKITIVIDAYIYIAYEIESLPLINRSQPNVQQAANNAAKATSLNPPTLVKLRRFSKRAFISVLISNIPPKIAIKANIPRPLTISPKKATEKRAVNPEKEAKT